MRLALTLVLVVITPNLLTLRVTPRFHDGIEIARDWALAKFHARQARWTAAPAFTATWVEAIATLLLLRLVWRGPRALRWPWHARSMRPASAS